MTTTKHSPYQSAVTVLATELNSLANNSRSGVSGSGTGIILDNSTLDDLELDLEFVLAAQASPRNSTAAIALYKCPSLDGTNYADANEQFAPGVALWGLDAATTARRLWAEGIRISPGLTKFFVVNSTGPSFAASGNTVKVRARSIATS